MSPGDDRGRPWRGPAQRVDNAASGSTAATVAPTTDTTFISADILVMADATTEEFEAALLQARAEGDMSRGNVVRILGGPAGRATVRRAADPAACGECGKEIPHTDPAYRVTVYMRRKVRRRWVDQMPAPGFVCAGCFATGRFRLVGRGEPLTGSRSRNARECQGCRRVVVLGADPCRTETWCSAACKSAVIRDRHRDTSANRSVPCEMCGGTLPPSRSDRRTCSPACRQRQYRQRVTGSRTGSSAVAS